MHQKVIYHAMQLGNMHFLNIFTGKGNGTPLQYSCLENPRDGGAWWAAVYGVAQSRTWLKRLSSSRILHLEGNSNPLQCSCLEKPRDRGACWAAVYGVAQSRTQLKRLSSSSSILCLECILWRVLGMCLDSLFLACRCEVVTAPFVKRSLVQGLTLLLGKRFVDYINVSPFLGLFCSIVQCVLSLTSQCHPRLL